VPYLLSPGEMLTCSAAFLHVLVNRSFKHFIQKSFLFACLELFAGALLSPGNGAGQGQAGGVEQGAVQTVPVHMNIRNKIKY
jgi:hypothetical protein